MPPATAKANRAMGTIRIRHAAEQAAVSVAWVFLVAIDYSCAEAGSCSSARTSSSVV